MSRKGNEIPIRCYRISFLSQVNKQPWSISLFNYLCPFCIMQYITFGLVPMLSFRSSFYTQFWLFNQCDPSSIWTLNVIIYNLSETPTITVTLKTPYTLLLLIIVQQFYWNGEVIISMTSSDSRGNKIAISSNYGFINSNAESVFWK